MRNERRSVRSIGASLVNVQGGFTLLEMTVVSVVLAIATAVVVPQWTRSLENAQVASLRLAVETDVATLCRTCTRQSLTVNLVVQPGTSRLFISPPLPAVLGDTSGLIDYSERFPGSHFAQVDLNGNDNCNINHLGDLVSSQSGESLRAGLLTIQGGRTTKSVDLLTLRSGLSIPTPAGEGERQASQANTAEGSSEDMDASTTEAVENDGSVQANAFMNSLRKLLGI